MQQISEKRRNWTITGTARSTGGSFDKVSVRGEAFVNGDLECETLKVMGTLHVTGNLKVGSAKVMGTIDVDADVAANQISVTGELTVAGACNAEKFTSKGAFSVGGLLNAGEIEIQLYGDSRARDIGGETITVKPHFRWFGSGYRELSVDTLEGDRIRIEHTTARVVRGNDVEIGPNCKVDMLEYQAKVAIDESSTVNEQVQR